MSKLPALVLVCLSATGITSAVACGSSEDPAPTEPTTTSTSTATTKPSGTPTTTASTTSTAPPKDAGADNDIPLGPLKPVRFVALGDQGKGCPSMAADAGPDAAAVDGQCKVAGAIYDKCVKDGCDFGVLLGDNFYPSGAASANDVIFNDYFEKPYKHLAFPFYVALGNHDYGANGAGTDYARGQYEVDYTLQSQKWKMPAKRYHELFGNGTLELFVADTNAAMVGVASQIIVPDAPKFAADDTAQRGELKQWTGASKAVWRFAMGHHPYLSNGTHGNAGCYDPVGGQCFLTTSLTRGDGVKSLLEDAVCGRVDFYLSGHDHSRQYLTEKCKGTELIVSGGGASTTSLGGKNATLFEKATIGFTYFKIDGKTLTVEMLDENGAVEFTKTITKP